MTNTTKGESKKYRCILIDPPTPQPMIGKFKGRHSSSDKLHYKTMTIEQIKSLPVEEYAEEGCHLWLWTTNAFLKDSFDFMAAWNFKYAKADNTVDDEYIVLKKLNSNSIKPIQ